MSPVEKKTNKTPPKRTRRQSGTSTPQAEVPAPQDTWDQILQSRARELARPLKEDENTETIEVVIFRLAFEIYGIATSHVREVHPLKDLTPLPCTPPFVTGIINVRGQVMSVIDLKKFFELPDQGITDLNKAVIISDGDMEFGILADAIVDVHNIPLQELQTSLPSLTGIRNDYLLGVAPDGLVVLDAGKLLSNSDLIVHEEVS